MKEFRKVIAVFLIVLLLFPIIFSFADGDGSSADLTGGSSESSGSDVDVNVGDETTIEAEEGQEHTEETTETETHESETGGGSTSSDTSTTDAAAIQSANAITDSIGARLSRYSGSSYVTYQYSDEQTPGFDLIETVKIPAHVLEELADTGTKIDPTVPNKQVEKNKLETRGLSNFQTLARLSIAGDMLDGVLGSEDFLLEIQKTLLAMNSNASVAITTFPPMPALDFDMDDLLDMIQNPDLIDPEDLPPIDLPDIDDFQDLLDDLDNIGVAPIEGLPQSRQVYDFYSLYDRYNALKTYMYLCKIADVKNVNVQHVVEMRIESCSRSLTVTETPVPYPAGIGYGDGTGMYAWAIECLESDYPDDVGYTDTVGVTKDRFLTYRFSTKGKFKLTYSQNIKKTVVSAVAYNLYEYWYIAQTGQIIYRRERLGTLNLGNNGANRSSARSGDRMACYISQRTEYAYMTESNQYGILGREMGSIIVNANANGQIIPDMSSINDKSYTYRIE